MKMPLVSEAPRRSRVRLIAALGAAGVLLWWATRGGAGSDATTGSGAEAGTDRAGGFSLPIPIRQLADGTWGASRLAPKRFGTDADGLAHVRGKVVDVHDGSLVGSVAVVFSGPGGEAETEASADGTYELALAPGSYHAFVRGDGVMSVSMPSIERLPSAPSADGVADAPATERAPAIAIARDTSGVDLPVERGGAVTGHVVDRAGHPIAHALVRARGELRSITGGDVAETDANGAYRLELPAGSYAVDATHPDYAGLESGVAELDLLPGTAQTSLDLTMVAGCIVRGRVTGPAAAGSIDGAIEARLDGGQFGPVGHIDPDGTFRFAMVTPADIDLRAWPWKSPPSAPQTFRCTEGARFDASFAVGDGTADLDGTIATADGRPAAGAFLDVIGTSEGAESQQERADADGKWAVYSMPPGDYLVMATVPGQGKVTKNVHVPAHGVALALGGTGAIDGMIKGASDGTMTLTIGLCEDAPPVAFDAPETRMVPVHDGHFHVDGVNACSLYVSTTYGGRALVAEVTVPVGGEGNLALDATPPPRVTVMGRVTEPDGRGASGVTVRALSNDGDDVSVATAAADGTYRIETEAGADLVVVAEGGEASGGVPTDARGTYNLDMRIEADLDGDPPPTKNVPPDDLPPDVPDQNAPL
jgi:hypothetical protein